MAFLQSAFVTIAEAEKNKKGSWRAACWGFTTVCHTVQQGGEARLFRAVSNTNLSHLEKTGNHSMKLWNVSYMGFDD